MNDIAILDIAQQMRIESALNYADSALKNPRMFKKIELTQRLRGMHSDDFDKLCDVVVSKSDYYRDQIVEVHFNTVKNIDFLVEKITTTAAMSTMQTNTIYNAINLLKLRPEQKNIQIIASVIFGCVSIIYNYSTFDTDQKVQLIEARTKTQREQMEKMCNLLTSCIHKEHARYLKRCVEEIKTRAVHLDNTANRIDFKFNALINAMQNCQSGDGFKQIAETALAAEQSENESFEHVSEPSSSRAEHAVAEYGVTATPSDIAADYHMEFADTMLQQLERQFAATDRVVQQSTAGNQEEEVV